MLMLSYRPHQRVISVVSEQMWQALTLRTWLGNFRSIRQVPDSLRLASWSKPLGCCRERMEARRGAGAVVTR